MTHILIADPNPASRKALSLLLTRRLGVLEIEEADAVENLIRKVLNQPPDILLLDWRLAGAPAPETCSLLRRAYPEMKIVLLSVDANNGETAEFAGASFIYKGASPDDVLATLQNLVKPEDGS